MKRFCAFFLAATCLPCLYFFVGCQSSADSGIRYEITAEYLPDDQTLTGTLKLSYENKSDAMRESLSFALYPNAYREGALYPPVSATYQSSAYYQGKSYGEMSVTSVHGGKGWQICGEDKNILSVMLETPLYAGDEVVLDISFITRLANVNHRTGVTERVVNLGNFFPILCADLGQGEIEIPYYNIGDPFVSECADYDVVLTVPQGYVVAATGTLQEERHLESKKKCIFSGENVRDFALAVSPSFRVEEGIVGKTTVRYYYVDDVKAKDRLALIEEAVTYFSSVFGEYPYPNYSVVQTGFCLGGMEYPAFAFVSSALAEEDMVRAVVHETAHQWWYAAVGSNQLCEAWQDEGLAEYSTTLFFGEHPQYGLTRDGLVQESLAACRAYHDVYGNVFGKTDGRMSRELNEYVSEYQYRVLAYDKGVVLLDTLRESVGEKKFFSALKKYYADNRYKIATVGDLIGAFERTGVDVAGLFAAFLEDKAII